MTTYYVGPGGSNANNGLSWANRKLTLNGAEDIPVAAGDTVYVGPGTYREALTVDVSGTSGNPITYIGDVTGHNTDGVGGVVRITGSDDDLSATRSNAISAVTKNYRTFQGFLLDSVTSTLASFATGCSNIIVQDCVLYPQNAAANMLSFSGTLSNITVRRCLIFGGTASSIIFTHSSTVNDVASLVENCLFVGPGSTSALRVERVGGVTAKNSTFLASGGGVRVAFALAAGQTLTTSNCLFLTCTTAMQATATGEIVEDYNTLWACGTNRTNVTAGSNSRSNPIFFDVGSLFAGRRDNPLALFGPAAFAAHRALAGSSESTDDFFGLSRPATSSKKSWGAIQFNPGQRDTATVRTGAASLRLGDAGRVQMYLPVSNVSTTVACYVRREADYAGTLPQMILRQPGQADITVTDTGSSGAWNQLTHTWTPAATPGYVVVELVSNNTATSGSYGVYFDDLTAS